jgi:hypothetical protein
MKGSSWWVPRLNLTQEDLNFVYTLIWCWWKIFGLWFIFYPLKLSFKYEKANGENPMFVENMGRSEKNTGWRGDKGKKNRAKLENAWIFLLHFQVLPIFLCDFLCASFDTREDYKREEACMFAFSLEWVSKFERQGLKWL